MNAIAFILKRDGPGFEFLEPAIERIGEFCAKYDTENDPGLLKDAVSRDLYDSAGRFLVVLSVCRESIVGHLLVAVVKPEWGYEKRLLVLQHEYDSGFAMPIDVARKVFNSVAQWGIDNDIHKIAAFALNDVIARKLHIFYGFSEIGRSMILDIG